MSVVSEWTTATVITFAFSLVSLCASVVALVVSLWQMHRKVVLVPDGYSLEDIDDDPDRATLFLSATLANCSSLPIAVAAMWLSHGSSRVQFDPHPRGVHWSRNETVVHHIIPPGPDEVIQGPEQSGITTGFPVAIPAYGAVRAIFYLQYLRSALPPDCGALDIIAETTRGSLLLKADLGGMQIEDRITFFDVRRGAEVIKEEGREGVR